MTDKKLKPCPFCGGKAKIGTTSHGHDVMSVYAVCTHCGAEGPVFMYDYWQYKKQMEQRGKARAAWNTRTNTIPVGNGENYEVTHNG